MYVHLASQILFPFVRSILQIESYEGALVLFLTGMLDSG
jgi:hypothetical protein